MRNENSVVIAVSQPVQHLLIHSPEDAQAARFSRVHRCDKAQTKHDDVDDQQPGRCRRSPAKKPREAFAQRRERKTQVRAALVASRRADPHQRSARRTNFWPWLAVSAHAEKSAHCALPVFHAPLPPIGKRQDSSLRPAYGVSIIPESRQSFSRSQGEEPARRKMDKFEEIGRRLDEELTRLRRFVEEEVAPETERRTAQFLREASQKLIEAAAKLESRHAARSSQNRPNPQPRLEQTDRKSTRLNSSHQIISY